MGLLTVVPDAETIRAANASLSSGATNFLFRGLGTALTCLVIAGLLWLTGNGNFAHYLLQTCSIGVLCWLTVDGGRMMTARIIAIRHPENAAACGGWPGWRVMSLVILVGTSAAYYLGSFLADTWLGNNTVHNDGMSLRGVAPFLLVAIVVSAIITGISFARERLASSRAEAEAARRLALENQLKLIESQLEPHMLFNTLANLRALIAADPGRALTMLDHLIDFLRATLTASRAKSHALEAEFERTADYLALMAVRMGPRLAVILDLPDELKALQVPPLLLQPLVENCIKHGLGPELSGGRIEISARKERDALVLEVRDTGVGLSPVSPHQGTGFGTHQIQERLAALYGDGARFSLVPAADPDGGTIGRIVLPITPR